MNVIKMERNFQIHLVVACIVIISSFYFKLSSIEWVAICVVIGLVLITEIINSAMEQMINYFKPEIHPNAKIIKDMAAAAVLVAAIVSVIVGLIIFVPKIYTLL